MMNSESDETVRMALVSMLRRCADFLANLPESDADALIRGDVELRLSLKAKKPSHRRKLAIVDSNILMNALDQLQILSSRADGERLLREVAPTKSALESLARHLDIPVRKGDNADDLLRRIIDSTIGFRLGSAAIQGRALHRDRENIDPATRSKNNPDQP